MHVVKKKSAIREINYWVEGKAKGKIRGILQLTSGVELILINAIHLKRNWKYQLQSTDTKRTSESRKRRPFEFR